MSLTMVLACALSSSSKNLTLLSLRGTLKSAPTGNYIFCLGDFNADMDNNRGTWKGVMEGRASLGLAQPPNCWSSAKRVVSLFFWASDRYLTLVLADKPNSSSAYQTFLVSLRGILESAQMGDNIVLLGSFNNVICNNSGTWKGIMEGMASVI